MHYENIIIGFPITIIGWGPILKASHNLSMKNSLIALNLLLSEFTGKHLIAALVPINYPEYVEPKAPLETYPPWWIFGPLILRVEISI